jgi:phosphate starvation-inducible PhoH-like protein
LVEKGAIVLKDELLSELCGANDQNLRTFEDLLGVNIFSRGNEIYIETEDEAVRLAFRQIIDQLEEHVRLGGKPCPDLLRALYDSVSEGDGRNVQLFKDRRIIIPKSNSRVFPRSLTQALYLDAIDRSELVFGVGPAGTGKTYLAVAAALRSVLSKHHRKLILTRPVVEAGESLGFLPGDLEQKINPYLRPLFDAMESLMSYDMIKEMEERRLIEIAPLAYMRGRSLVDSFVILDEAQNTTHEQMKMFLTRIGERSQTIVTGDITQIDLHRKGDSGLLHVISILKPIQEIRFVFFSEADVVRNPLVRKIVQAYEKQDKEE